MIGNDFSRAASGRPDMSCLWKLLGDACTLLYPVPDDSLRISVPRKLFGTSEEAEDSGTEIDKKDLLALGTRYLDEIHEYLIHSFPYQIFRLS